MNKFCLVGLVLWATVCSASQLNFDEGWISFETGRSDVGNSGSSIDNAIRLYDLKSEHLTNPIGLDVLQPRLSWKLEATDSAVKNIQQKSYRVLVASSPELLASNNADLWDSGVVASAQSVLIPYDGKKLTSRQTCYWKVQVTDNQNHQSDWSEVAQWEMALLQPQDWAGSQWIGLKNDTRDSEYAARQHLQLNEAVRSHPSPLLRKEINIQKEIRQARAYVSGIGYCEFYINGKKISDHVLDPGQTNYEKHTLYVVHDITDALQSGTNALGVWLGSGFYGQNLAFNTKLGYGQPSVRAKLFIEYTDGSTEEIVTDTGWKATVSPIVFDNVYWGESYDARLEIAAWAKPGLDDSTWQTAIKVPAPCPDNDLRPQLIPAIKEMERIKPVSIREVEPQTWQLDFGKNIAGWVHIKVNQKSGDVIKITSSEVLDPQTGRTDNRTQGGGATGHHHELIYICNGDGDESWAPRFCYTGFQYVEISGMAKAPTAEDVEAIFVRSSIEKTGSFASSNEMLNKQYAASLLSLEGNWHSLPEDCPHREKCGWLGDAHATADLCLYNYDILRFYSKFNQDIQNSLTTQYGSGDGGGFKVGKRISEVPKGLRGVPTFVAPGKRTSGLGSIDWGVAYLILPWQMYLHSGDVETFQPHYEHIKDFIAYFRAYKTRQGVINNGLGDWCPPRWDRRAAPQFMECHPHVSGTAFYYQSLKIASQMAQVLGDKEYSQQCLTEADEIKSAFAKVYLKPIEKTNLKHFGSQTATAMALKFGMVAEADIEDRVDALVHDINQLHDGHHACGIHGLRHLYTVLADHGEDELVYKMLTDTTFPGPGYVMSLGLTTWPERRLEWDKVRLSNSFNHPMNGGFTAFMHESLGGIRPNEAAPGYKHFVLKPQLTNLSQPIDWVKTSVETAYGKIRSDWKNDGQRFSWDVEVPANTTATLWIPYSSDRKLSESSERELPKARKLIKESGQQWLQCEVGSGRYSIGLEPSTAP